MIHLIEVNEGAFIDASKISEVYFDDTTKECFVFLAGCDTRIAVTREYIKDFFRQLQVINDNESCDIRKVIRLIDD